jgi:hypothetical protein
MLECFKDFWKAISTGWVVEYPKEGQEPTDFFNQKKG